MDTRSILGKPETTDAVNESTALRRKAQFGNAYFESSQTSLDIESDLNNDDAVAQL